MTTPTHPSSAAFQQQIFLELDHKLRATPWGSGAAEAHGLLTGLACGGVSADTVRTFGYLLKLVEPADLTIIEGMFSLLERDLADPSFSFTLMLPDESEPLAERIEAISGWCQGYLQGLFHRDTALLDASPRDVREALEDIIEIGHIEAETGLSRAEQTSGERAVTEIEEFLRVAVQLVYDHTHPATSEPRTSSLN